MAVPEQTPYNEFTANGITKIFPLEFDILEKDHLIVLVDDLEPTVGSWSLDLINNSVVFALPPANGANIKITRNTPLERTTDYQSYDNSFRPQPVNSDFDRIWWKLQELWVQVTFLWAFIKSAVQDLWDGLNNEIKNRIEADLAIRSWVTILLNNIVDSGLVSAIAVTTVESVNDLQYLLKWDGRTVYVKSYHVGLSMGGGTFTYTPSKALQNDSGVIINGWVRINFGSITPLLFGAKGDAAFDDRPSFQNAINYLRNNGGGELAVPRPIVEYRWKSYDVANSACLVIEKPLRSIYVDPITMRGMGNLISIKVDLGVGVLIEAALLLKGGGLYKKFENLSIYGGVDYNNKNCKRVFKGIDTFYPNLTVSNCQFYVATEYCFHVQTFVFTFSQLQTAYSKRGIVVEGFGNPQTSGTLNSCYALNHDHYGYWFGETTYCTFNSCASDHIINNLGDGVEAYPYYIDIARGVTFNGCGAESSTRILHVRSAQGLTINGIMTLSIGDNTNPPNQLIRIDGGASTTIGGLWNQNPKGFTFKLRLGNAVSAESVTVLDQSIAPSECSWVSNFRFDSPIRFLLWDYSRKVQDITLVNTGDSTTNTTNLNNAVKNAYDLELLHDVIIRFPSGDFEINSAVYLSSALTRGQGRVRLIGNADGTSRLVVNSSGTLSFGRATTLSKLNYTVENLNLYTLNGGTRGILFNRSDVTFINSKITSDNGVKQWAGDRVSSITLDANSFIGTSIFSAPEIKYSYKATTAPTNSTRLPVGTRFDASDPNATRIGWINTVDNGLSWLAISPS